MRLSTRILCGLALSFGLTTIANAANKSASVVKVSAKAGKIDSKGIQEVTLTLNIDKNWHLYANPVGSEMLVGAQTTVSFKKPTKVIKIEYPKGHFVKDEFVGNYFTYEGKVTIKAKIQRKSGSEEPLSLTIKVQACDAMSCLPPSKIPVTVK